MIKRMIAICLSILLCFGRSSEAFAVCSMTPVISQQLLPDYSDDFAYLTKEIEESYQLVIACRLFATENKPYSEPFVKMLKYCLWETCGYVDFAALGNAIRYENQDGYWTFFLQPSYVRKIKAGSLDTSILRRILKNLDISTDTSQKAACYRISKWIIQNFTYDTSQIYNFDLKAQFQKRKMSCHGYSSLFYALAKECGVDVHYVETSNHAYNYAVIKGIKRYYDLTNATAYKIYQKDGRKKKKKVINKSCVYQRISPNNQTVINEF